MFTQIRASSWEEVKTNFSHRALWAYRGQSSSNWLLETSLYREAQRKYSQPHNMLRSRESWILYQFGRYAHQLRDNLPDPQNTLDWLALIQHYGGPTRLLDWTYSVHIAAFFAVENATQDAAIWAINLPSLEAATHKRLRFNPAGRIDQIRQAHNNKFEKLMFNEKAPTAVMHVEPDQMHERLWTQQGLFLAPTDPNKPFMTNLANTFGMNQKKLDFSVEHKWSEELDDQTWLDYGEGDYISVVKIIIPREMHQEVLEDLSSVNISAATLFPGLEGFARSLKYHV